jgi:hypothetical protein
MKGASQHAWFPQTNNTTTVLCSLKPMLAIKPQNSHCPQAWFPLCWLQSHWTVLLEAWARKQISEFLLPTGLVPLSYHGS